MFLIDLNIKIQENNMDSLNGKPLCEKSNSEDGVMEDLTLKKVRFRENGEATYSELLVDDSFAPPMSWKEKLLGTTSRAINFGRSEDEKEDFDLLEEDLLISTL